MQPAQSLAVHHLERLRQEWPALLDRIGPAPQLDWEDWKEALLSFTHCQEHEFLVRSALSAIIRQSPEKPGYLILEDLLIVAIASHNDAWRFPESSNPDGSRPDSLDEEGAMP
jgi:hypothetical protein